MLDSFTPAVRAWFAESFEQPTTAQQKAWPVIARGEHTLLLAPTGSGKTLAAFLVAIDRLVESGRDTADGVHVLYISPLKALGVDVERNLRLPLAGVQAVAERDGLNVTLPRVAIRSGDTSSAERREIHQHPPDILITTPESLYLMLTSQAREILRTVDVVILDEIHSLVATKRGAHLAISLERLEWLRAESRGDADEPAQRIGLSATQRPLEEVARFLGGVVAAADADETPRARPVSIVEAGRRKQLELTIEVPVEDMARLADQQSRSRDDESRSTLPSIWPAIHPRLVELIREHTSTMIFVNARRLAERLSAAINELAGEEIALAHHGSIAKDTRQQTEDRLKRGQLPAIVATSSLELGIDMGAVDLVIQIESPPSIVAGMQRIGRSGHQVGAPSTGVVFPKFRGDLLACSAAAERMQQGEVEETFYPRNPLDVLAQQIVAIAAGGAVSVDDLFALARSAAPFADLPRSSFDGVLDLLSGRYPSSDFAGLRPRIDWDRHNGEITPRRGTQRIAILNAGTIPDRGLFGVFMVGEDGGPGNRVGELDEEMVFETRVGDVFLLGASSWRALEVTHDRVIVAPAPGEPGKMPFWKGDGPGRPFEFGQAIGALTRQLNGMDAQAAREKLSTDHGLDERAAKNLIRYLADQAEATGHVPSDRMLIVESFLDEVGDWRVTILSPFGVPVHAPWATAVAGRLRRESPGEVDILWTDDGIVFRLPEADGPPPIEALFPSPDEIEDLVVKELGTTAMFAARFRENAARALLLPRRWPGQRTPLWQQRRRAADLLNVAARYPSFPIMLETFRECLRDVFDLPSLKKLLGSVERREIRVRMLTSQSPSPFAASLLFNFIGNFVYDGDAPLSERRAHALALDHTQLRELLGDAELRELLDAGVVEELTLQLQRLDGRFEVRDAEGVDDLLRQLGDLSREEIAARCGEQAHSVGDWLTQLTDRQRIVSLQIAGEERCVIAEDAARYRDALGVEIPPGLPDALLGATDDPLSDLVSRFARTHVPFRVEDAATRFGIGTGPVRLALQRLPARDRVVEGEFLPGRRGREWCDSDVLRTLKRRSLEKLRKQIEPVEPERLARFLVDWQGVSEPHRGLDGLLDVVAQLQGLPLPVSVLERDILPARLSDYRVGALDELCSAGEVVWRGCGSLGPADGRVALYLTDDFPLLAPMPAVAGFNRSGVAGVERSEPPVAGTLGARGARPQPPAFVVRGTTESSYDDLQDQIRDLLRERGAVFFDVILSTLGGFRNDVRDALWSLVWAGVVTNDSLRPTRSIVQESQPARRRASRRVSERYRSRRSVQLPGTEGRWSLLEYGSATPTERQTALAEQLIERYGMLTREMVTSEGPAGGFAGLYPVLKAMEEAGRIRRGYFVAGLGAAQFAAPGADERLRQRPNAEARTTVLAAVDPANPYGAALAWPDIADNASRPQRAAGARVILHDGHLLGWLSRNGESLTTFLPDGSAERCSALDRLIDALIGTSASRQPLMLTRIDADAAADSPLTDEFVRRGFGVSGAGLLCRGTERV